VVKARLPIAILTKHGAALSAPFTSHDLRRSAVTHIAESLGIGGEPLIKRLLGHADGSVTAIYNRYGYMREMRAALERGLANSRGSP
jgi:integrase